MASRDSLGSTLSDEETDAVVQSSEIPSGITAPAPPAAASFGDPTYKFTFRSPQKMPDNEKNTNGNSNSSSEDDFEHVNPDEMSGEAHEVGTNSVPSTPTKVTPHKRTADAAHGTAIAASPGTGSPPRSPVPKRKKWEDYLKEDDEKLQRDKSQSPSPSSQDSAKSLKLERSLKMKITLSVIVCALAIGWMGWYPQSGLVKSKKPHYSWKNAHTSFFNKTKAMEIEFPNQNRETWIQIYAAISSTMEKTEPVHPACITVLLPPKMGMNFASCLLRKVGNAVNEAVAPILNIVDGTPAAVVTINPSTIPEDSISKFRSDIEEYFGNGKAVITFELEEFKAEFVLMQLYGLCDSYKAIDKRATVLFPVRVPQEIFQKFEWLHGMGGEISDAVLSEVWKPTLAPGTIPAMIVRITDSVILLNEGDECSL